jgi:hypothetical protein
MWRGGRVLATRGRQRQGSRWTSHVQIRGCEFRALFSAYLRASLRLPLVPHTRAVLRLAATRKHVEDRASRWDTSAPPASHLKPVLHWR